MAKSINNNNGTEDKWSLSKLRPWNDAMRDYYLTGDTGPDDDFDEKDAIEMCKTTACAVEMHRANACIKAEKTYVVKYGAHNFAELSDRRKEKCYQYMKEQQARLQELMDMPHYQAQRTRRHLRLKDAYLERRHHKRLYAKMKSLLSVADQDYSAQNFDDYQSVEYLEETFESVQSSQTVIHRPPKSTKKSIKSTSTATTTTTATKTATATAKPNKLATKRASKPLTPKSSKKKSVAEEIIDSERVPSSSISIAPTERDERYNHYISPDAMDEDTEMSEAESMFDYVSGDNEIISLDVDSSDDESSPSNEFNFERLNTSPTESSQIRRSTRLSQVQIPSQTYSQFERSGLVTSTQD